MLTCKQRKQPPYFSSFEADLETVSANVYLICQHHATSPVFILIIDRCKITRALISVSVTNWLA